MTMQRLTQERLKELLNYNPETGVFVWKLGRRNGVKGKVAGYHDGKGYIRITIDGNYHRAHRLAFLYIEGHFPQNQVDHKNHIKDDNRFGNLRMCTNKENHKNRTLNDNNKSGIVGVRWNKTIRRWVTQISNNNGKRKSLGTYKEKNHAIIARWLAEDKYGYHENHGK